ncbi:MAG: hypothetical protein ACKVOH_03945 [Chlamydiales bacterium]
MFQLKRGILICSLLLLCGCSFFSKREQKVESPPVEFLFIVHGKKGDFVRNPDNLKQGTLSIQGVNKRVIFFSDRPVRDAGSIPMQKFIDLWHTGTMNFNDVPPNAGFVFFENNDKKFSDIPVKITLPSYDEQRNTLTLQVDSLIGDFEEDKAGMLEVTLFIDPWKGIDMEKWRL